MCLDYLSRRRFLQFSAASAAAIAASDPAGGPAPEATAATAPLPAPPAQGIAVEIVGYSDRLSAAPGETVRFMVSCQALAQNRRGLTDW